MRRVDLLKSASVIQLAESPPAIDECHLLRRVEAREAGADGRSSSERVVLLLIDRMSGALVEPGLSLQQ